MKSTFTTTKTGIVEHPKFNVNTNDCMRSLKLDTCQPRIKKKTSYHECININNFLPLLTKASFLRFILFFILLYIG